MGIITDRKSPRLAAIIGMLALLAGYYPIKLGMTGVIQRKHMADCWQRMIVVLEA
jgi:hypothetical protein